MAERFLAAITLLRKLGSGGRPDQGLPPGEPGSPDQGLPPGESYPDQGLPPIDGEGGSPPVGIWPDPGTPAHPIVTPPPAAPGHPSHPIVIRPPGQPSLPIYIPIEPDGTPPEVANPIYPPLRPTHPIEYPDGEVWLLVYIPYVGWKYVKLDLTGAQPDQGLPVPPTAQPK